ncbi:MAG: saccharopine dehydrogenase NADP-binding domain-containing protein [Bacteroidetes bacterium]|nr:saccharopine dehydrogenase NADP-binding domain-containing protein [Bacteroidota bacterium]
MKTKILILGAGLVGRPMALDLVNDISFDVDVADISEAQLKNIGDDRVQKIQADLSNETDLKTMVVPYDLILNAVPGSIGFNTLKWCIEAGKDVVDIAFYPEDPLELSELAKAKNVRVICDIGVAPGMSNMLTGYAAHQLDHVSKVDIYVGGLPKVRTKPWEYKAVFSPADVIEEYTRPARLVEHSNIVTKPALTEIELLEFENVGTLEAFNSDGLRSLMFTIEADQMREKTLRYPGYAEKIKLLKNNGFFNSKVIDVSGKQVSPLEMTSKLLFDQWKLQSGEVDITVMRIVIEGQKDGELLRFQYDLYDEYDPETGIHSMARTTGYTATMAIRLLNKGLYTTTGITVPEFLGKEKKVVDFMLDGLIKRGIIYKSSVNKLV